MHWFPQGINYILFWCISFADTVHRYLCIHPLLCWHLFISSSCMECPVYLWQAHKTDTFVANKIHASLSSPHPSQDYISFLLCARGAQGHTGYQKSDVLISVFCFSTSICFPKTPRLVFFNFVSTKYTFLQQLKAYNLNMCDLITHSVTVFSQPLKEIVYEDNNDHGQFPSTLKRHSC